MKCSKCGSEQDEGKFCGKCGGALISVANTPPAVDQVAQDSSIQNEQASVQQEPNNHTNTQTGQQVQQETAATTSEPVSQAEPNESIEKVKETSRAYGGFFKSYIKVPSQIFSRQASELTNGLISIGIVVILMTLTFYTLINNATSGFYGGFDIGPSFLQVFGNSLIGLLVTISIIITLLFLINKFFGTDSTYKEMISIFGAHMTPVSIVVLIAFILSILKSNTYAVVFLSIAIALILSLVPLYIISSLLTRRPKGIDPFYGYLLYIIAVGITFSVLMSILLDSAFGNMMDYIW